MHPLAKKFDLGPNQFAILFETSKGIEADDLGNFLKRAATLARGKGVELRVVRFEPGSLATIFEAVKRGAKDEFLKAPIGTTLKAAGLVGVVGTALIGGFNFAANGFTPIAKAGVCVVEEKEVTTIKLITQYDVVLLMDENLASQFRQLERDVRKSKAMGSKRQFSLMAEDARRGDLIGEILEAGGALHFRPEGFNFLVPIKSAGNIASSKLRPGSFVRVNGDLKMRMNRPDSLVVYGASEI